MDRNEFLQVIKKCRLNEKRFYATEQEISELWSWLGEGVTRCNPFDFQAACYRAMQKHRLGNPSPEQIKQELQKNLLQPAKISARTQPSAKFSASYDATMQRQGLTKVFGISSSGRIYSSFERSPVLGDLEWEDGDEDKRKRALLVAKSQQV